MKKRLFFLFLFVSILSFEGCKRPRKLVLTKDQSSRIKENILKETPKTSIELGANLENSIKLIGVNLSSNTLKKGETLTITYFWECLKELKGEWKVFVHLEMPGPRRMILDHHPVGELYPIEQWKAGEIIKDEQRVVIPDDVQKGEAIIWVGVFNEETYREQGGGDRLVLINKDKVQNDGENRIKAATFTIVEEKKPSSEEKKTLRQKPSLRALKTNEKINIDGRLDENIWKIAIPSDPFLRPDGLALNERFETRVRSVYDNEYLYFGFNIKDDDIFNEKKSRDDSLWQQDVIEIFLNPDGSGKNYYEIQVSPANIIFDAFFSDHRTPQWEKAKEFNFKGLKTAVNVNGSLNKRDDGVNDASYNVEVAIPFSEIKELKKFPPEVGEKWVVNFYRIDNKGAGNPEYQGAFSPTGGDFHNLMEAGELLFTPTLTDLIRTIPPTVKFPPRGEMIKTLRESPKPQMRKK